MIKWTIAIKWNVYHESLELIRELRTISISQFHPIRLTVWKVKVLHGQIDRKFSIGSDSDVFRLLTAAFQANSSIDRDAMTYFKQFFRHFTEFLQIWPHATKVSWNLPRSRLDFSSIDWHAGPLRVCWWTWLTFTVSLVLICDLFAIFLVLCKLFVCEIIFAVDFWNFMRGPAAVKFVRVNWKILMKWDRIN